MRSSSLALALLALAMLGQIAAVVRKRHDINSEFAAPRYHPDRVSHGGPISGRRTGPCCVVFHGGLGSGKSTLVQALFEVPSEPAVDVRDLANGITVIDAPGFDRNDPDQRSRALGFLKASAEEMQYRQKPIARLYYVLDVSRSMSGNFAKYLQAMALFYGEAAVRQVVFVMNKCDLHMQLSAELQADYASKIKDEFGRVSADRAAIRILWTSTKRSTCQLVEDFHNTALDVPVYVPGVITIVLNPVDLPAVRDRMAQLEEEIDNTRRSLAIDLQNLQAYHSRTTAPLEKIASSTRELHAKRQHLLEFENCVEKGVKLLARIRLRHEEIEMFNQICLGLQVIGWVVDTSGVVSGGAKLVLTGVRFAAKQAKAEAKSEKTETKFDKSTMEAIVESAKQWIAVLRQQIAAQEAILSSALKELGDMVQEIPDLNSKHQTLLFQLQDQLATLQAKERQLTNADVLDTFQISSLDDLLK